MKILLINPMVPISSRVTSVPLGLLSIASYLQSCGHTVRLEDRTLSRSRPDRFIGDLAPDIAGIAMISAMSYKDTKALTETLHRYGVPVALGGQFCTALPEMCLRDTGADYVVTGEGELTWAELVRCLELHESPASVRGLVFRQDGAYIRTPERDFVSLAELPDLDWTLIEPERYFQTFFGCNRMLYIYAAKGCPGNCSFCYNPSFHHRKQRVRPPEQVVREMKYLCEHTAVDGFYFSDEFWYCKKEDIERFCSLIKENGIHAIWGCNTRVGALSEETVELMYSAGCRWLLYGIESGNKERLRQIGKGIDLDKAQHGFDVCRRLGISTQSTFIIGFPGETVEELKQNVALAKQLNANMVPFNILYPQPGSVIYHYVKEKYPAALPVNVRQWSSIDIGKKLVVNLSRIPLTDMKVVMYRYQWNAFTDKDSISGASYGIFKKAAKDALQKLFHGGITDFIYGAAADAVQFATVFFYANCFPNKLKKYGLK